MFSGLPNAPGRLGGPPPFAAVRVYGEEDLRAPLSSDKLYIIEGSITLSGDFSIEVPEGGLRIGGYGFGVSGLTSSAENFTLFVQEAGAAYAGDLFLSNMDISVTGSGSKVFNLNNSGNGNTVEVGSSNFVNCTSIGELTEYRQFRLDGAAIFGGGDGLTFSGTWSGGLAITNSIALGTGSGVTLFKAGTGLLFQGSVRSNMNTVDIDDAATVFDFAPANVSSDAGFALSDFRTNPNANAVPNFPANSLKARFSACSGIENTYPGTAWTVTSSAETVITTQDVFVKMAGTTTTLAGETWFTTLNDNEVKFASDQVGRYRVLASLSFTGGINREVGVQLRQWDASANSGAGQYVDIGAEVTATLNGGPAGTRAENVAIAAWADNDKGDWVTVFIRNKTDTTNITADDAGALFIEERPS